LYFQCFVKFEAASGTGVGEGKLDLAWANEWFGENKHLFAEAATVEKALVAILVLV
jgi:hypothetical protein